jgi:hypothetical protein
MKKLPDLATMDEVDVFLAPLVNLVISMEAPVRSAPGQWDPMITSVK